MGKVLEKAIAEIGTKEVPANSNKTKYGLWYGMNGVAWCAIFVSWCYDQAGFPLGKVDSGKGYHYCPSAFNFWKKSGEITNSPKPDDIVLFDWNADKKSDHTGIFEKDNGDGKTFTCIEGNTAVGNDSNGGNVMRRTDRKYTQVLAFIHPKVLG